jgi:hypothetical protein
MVSGILDSALAYLNAAYVVMTLIKVGRDQTFGWSIRWRSSKYDYTTRDERLILYEFPALYTLCIKVF